MKKVPNEDNLKFFTRITVVYKKKKEMKRRLTSDEHSMSVKRVFWFS